MNRPPSSSGRKPTTGMRPPSGLRQPPPGTAMRMPPGTGAPGTARPGTRGGAGPSTGAVLNANINVADRPTTQQGLGGLKTGRKGPSRVVMDKSYFLGLLRTKMNELTTENNKLQREIDRINEENNSFLSYEKKAEGVAAEIKELQGQLGDYNTLVDKLNTDTEMDEVQEDYNQLKVENDLESKNIDTIFTTRQETESQIAQVDEEIQQCRRMADTLVDDMKPQMRSKYQNLKVKNETLLRQLEERQQKIDSLSTKKDSLEEELQHSQVKQEAVRLYEQLHELVDKKNQLIAEEQSRGTPAEEREKLLKQVKEDNQEIGSMERQIKEIKEKLEDTMEEISQVDVDLEEHQGEKNMKYKELKKREESMNEFLETFESAKKEEIERRSTSEETIVTLLSHTSRNLGRQKHMPTPQELARMQDDLSFKQTEMHKSEATASGLTGESSRLQMDLQKVEQLEGKITAELESLKVRIKEMEEELKTYSDLDSLQKNADLKKKKLQEDKITLARRRDVLKKSVQLLSSQYEALKSQLNDNETHSQLGNLERKWQHYEQNNYVMKEFIAAKSMESDYRPLVAKVREQVGDYNRMLQDILVKGVQR
ncbi:intraflagellar transport protein 74 homolog [Lytechinus variegatus]|uniref:intraflagellar transport protein 74 homolog n=1 Tax=Lytechinus variegatus TaxID=7654 RepID=UPI001BB1F2CB|nr:intraflagellar transport protein 74 homolog [Lytechinus variegatus]